MARSIEQKGEHLRGLGFKADASLRFPKFQAEKIKLVISERSHMGRAVMELQRGSPAKRVK